MTTKNKKEIIIQNLTAETIYIHATRISTTNKDELTIKCYDSISKPKVITLGSIITLPSQKNYIITLKPSASFECIWDAKRSISCSRGYIDNGWYITFHNFKNLEN